MPATLTTRASGWQDAQTQVLAERSAWAGSTIDHATLTFTKAATNPRQSPQGGHSDNADAMNSGRFAVYGLLPSVRENDMAVLIWKGTFGKTKANLHS